MTRAEFLGGCLVALLITCSPGLAGVVVTALTGPDRLDAPTTSSVRSQGEGDRTEEHSPWITPRPRAVTREASRSRAVVRHTAGGVGTLNWTALAACESSGDPRAVSPSGTYRGLVQFSLSSWRAVGMSGDPIDYPASVQLAAAQRLYDLQGPGAWPYCRRFL